MKPNAILAGIKNALDFNLFSVAGTPINLATIVTFVLIVLVTYLLSRTARRTMARFLRNRGIVDPGAVQVQLRLAHFLIMALGVGVAFHSHRTLASSVL